MRKKLLSFILLSIALTNLNAQSLITAGAAGQDYGKDIDIDQQGNIVSAGYFYNTVDFDPSGITNNKTSVGNADNYISKYDTAGSLLWTISYGSLGVDIPHSVVTDLNNNIIVSGYFCSKDMYVIACHAMTHYAMIRWYLSSLTPCSVICDNE